MPSAGELEEVARAKHAVRERVWARLETDHDFRLDVIVAGEEVITCRRARRPKGRPGTRPRRRLDRHDGAPREVWTVPQWGTQAAV